MCNDFVYDTFSKDHLKNGLIAKLAASVKILPFSPFDRI
jgi:hypothetical protein